MSDEMKSNEPRRSFTISNRAWYGNRTNLPEVTFGMCYEDGSVVGEIGMRWYDLRSSLPSPRIEVFHDAWGVLYTFMDVLEKLAEQDNKKMTVDKFVEILVSCGFVDDTPYELSKSPYKLLLENEG